MDYDENLIDHLYTAVHIGDLNKIKQISHYLSTKMQWFPNYELLCIAFLHKHINIARFFLNINCDVYGDNDKNYRGNSALHLAVLYGDSSLVNTILRNGAPHNIRNGDGLLPIHLVVYRNPTISRSILPPGEFDNESSKIINVLLQYDLNIDDVVNSYAKYGYTALHLAAECGNENIVPILIKAKANFNAKSEIGLTPLHVAVINGNCQIVHFLLQQGVTAFPKDHRAKTPLCWAIEQEQVDMIQIILNFRPIHQKNMKHTFRCLSLKNDYCSILTAVKKNNFQLVEYLLSKGASVNVSWKNGTTPVHIAVENGSEDILQVLLNHGAEATAVAKDGKTPLYLAVEREWLNIIKILLSHVPGINSSIYLSNVDGLTPLHLAVKKGNEEIIKLLLQSGKPFFDPECNVSPLHIAVLQNKRNILKILLDNRINCDTTNSFGKTALQVAVKQGSLEIIQVFCDFYSTRAEKWKEGYAALHIAALNGREKVVKLLLETGADLNARTEDYLTPLIAAAEKGHLNIVQLLLKYGVYVDECRNDGKTALHVAVENGSQQVVEYLLNNGANVNGKVLGNTPLHYASFVGNFEIVRLLVSNGADVNARNLSDATPLFVAVDKNWEKIVKYLVENGANVNIQDQDSTIKSFNFRSDCIYNLNSFRGLRPLLLAIDQNCNQEIVEILLKNGCPADIVGERVSPLHLASANGNLPIVKLLLEYGADINWICEEKFTPLSHAIDNGRTETIMFLVSTGINFQDNEKNSTLHIALRRTEKNERIVEFFLDFGADVNARNFKNETPLHCAISNENGIEEQKLFRLLLDYGSDMNLIDEEGNTALHLSALKGDAAAAQVFLDYGASINALDNAGRTPLKCLEDFIRDDLILYSTKSDSEICPFAKIAILFVTLIALRESRGEFVNNENFVTLQSQKMNYFYEKCKRELSQMKLRKIYRNISYYDMLTKRDLVLYFYLRHEDIVRNLQLESLKKLFPCYAAMITSRVRKARERRTLIVSSEQYLQQILKTNFPVLITSEIFKYLSSADMKNMYRALYRRKNVIMKSFNRL